MAVQETPYSYVEGGINLATSTFDTPDDLSGMLHEHVSGLTE
jgi:hypothetical protein